MTLLVIPSSVLYMENPIKYIGYVRRDDIEFEIVNKREDKLPKAEYEAEKTKSLDDRIVKWLENNEKTIVLFPLRIPCT